ncbi:hypothetical protein PRIPAC_79431 [Pristionchus pacificus]|nr:hypothetical protein PRIPAC_79431 [Pristionchus pacificus]
MCGHHEKGKKEEKMKKKEGKKKRRDTHPGHPLRQGMEKIKPPKKHSSSSSKSAGQKASSNASFVNVILAPILDSTIGGVGRTKARVIEGWGGVMDAFLAECNATLSHPGLIEQLRAEKFDVAYTEPSLDYCGPGLFYLLGIDKWAIMNSLAIVDGDFHYSQIASNPSYVPSAGAMFGGNMGEAMSFSERFHNFLILLATNYFFRPYLYKYTQIMRQFDPTMPETEAEH